MKKIIRYTMLTLLTALTVTVQAKDRDDRYDRDRRDHREDDRRHSRYRHQDETRVIYLIEHGRPVARTVFVDSSGSFYTLNDGRRTYVRDHYFESYPSRYFTPSGQRRLFIRLPF